MPHIAKVSPMPLVAASLVLSTLMGSAAAAPETVSGPALNEGRGIVRSDDYPAGSMRRREQGTTTITFQVRPDGRVINCEVSKSTGFPDLDAASCALFVHRARYTPKPDSNGVDQRTIPVRWNLPR